MSKINVIDIGAVGGFDIPWSRHQHKIGRSLSFEPNEPSILTGDNLRYNTAVWNFDGEAKFYISGPNGVGSSLLSQNIEWVAENFDDIKSDGNPKLNNSWVERSQIKGEFTAQVRKLDTILSDLDLEIGHHVPFHFLKSDTQSGEFFVLEGAEKFLKQDCLGLELELYRYPLYQGLVTEDRVKEHLKELGFKVVGWTGYQNSFNSQADYLFVRQEPRNEGEALIIENILNIYRPQGQEGIIKRPAITQRLRSRIKSILSR